MLTYDMDARQGQSKYTFLYECIRHDIITGKLMPNEKLPSKRSLAEHLNISTVTVMNAYDQLLLEGFIYSKQRAGYFVQSLEYVLDNTRSGIQGLARTPGSLSEPTQTPDCLAGTAHNLTDTRHQQTNVPIDTRRQHPSVSSDTEPFEDTLIDAKANRISLSLFPLTIWKRYMRQALSLDSKSLLEPIPFQGLRELRMSLAHMLAQRKGMHVHPEQIIIGSGTEYLYGKLLQLMSDDTVLALENPGYMKLARIADTYGKQSVFINLDHDGLSVSELEKSGADIVHVSPANNFPTGMIMPIRRRLEILNWASKKAGRYIIEDDYDSEFRYAGNHITPLFEHSTHDNVIYMNTFSKTLVPSIRISYMVLPHDLLKRYQETLSFYACTVSSFEQYALSLFIDSGHFDRHLNRLKKYYREQRACILVALRSSALKDRMYIFEQNSGTHVLISIRTDLSEQDLYARGLKEHLILSFLSEYTHENMTRNGTVVIVFNYASIQPDDVPAVIQKLEHIILDNDA